MIWLVLTIERTTCDTVALNVSEIVTIEDRADNNYGNRRSFSYVKMKNGYGYEVKENINEIMAMLQ